MQTYRIHGDNIVECERIINIIKTTINPDKVSNTLVSSSVVCWNLIFQHNEQLYEWNIELLPGFNKAGRTRWEDDIFNILRKSGSFLDETPDAIITKIEGDTETILCAIEFCSALQAGNQAWQRSGRAYSTGLALCPYLYIVDFVKYELDSITRKRKNLRFPNPIVPFSFISFSDSSGGFVVQAYVKSEEFDKQFDYSLENFDEENFAEEEIGCFIFSKMMGLDTTPIEKKLLEKNKNVVEFLASLNSDFSGSLTSEEWKRLINSSKSIVSFSCEINRFRFHKTIAKKSLHGHAAEVQALTESNSVGLAAKDMPFGIIPKKNRKQYIQGLIRLYPELSDQVFGWMQCQEKDLIVCFMKGFKPKGDDNRPDRGLLPLIRMLTSEDIEVLTFIYGPVLNNNLQMLFSDPERLGNSNGLWKTIIRLTDYLLLDVPVLHGDKKDTEVLTSFDSDRKLGIAYREVVSRPLEGKIFKSAVTSFHEDDVDTAIHYLFSDLLSSFCFEGMCNPPGGDWSGFSLIQNSIEYRWLSLPRVSDDVAGKRPDHIIQLGFVDKNPLILLIESKERPEDLELKVGDGLKNYISALSNFVPSVQKKIGESDWIKSSEKVSFQSFNILSCAAYIENERISNESIFENSNCDLLFAVTPCSNKPYWQVRITPRNELACHFKTELSKKLLEVKTDLYSII